MQYTDERGKIFIGGLSWDTTHASMLKYFSRYGEVIDCVVMKNPATGKSRGFGFVTFKDPACVDTVLSSGPHILDDRQIDPKACNPRSMNKGGKNMENSKRKIFIGGLPANITESQLKDHFIKYGNVTEVVIMYDQQKQKSRGFGFLTFDTEDSVDLVVKEHYIQINGKQVEVKKAEPRDLKMIADCASTAYYVTPGYGSALGLVPTQLASALAAVSNQNMLTNSPYPAVPVSASWCSPSGQGLRIVTPNSPVLLIAPSGGRTNGTLTSNGLTYTAWPQVSNHNISGNELSPYSPNSSPVSYEGSMSSHTYSSILGSELSPLYTINGTQGGQFGIVGGGADLDKPLGCATYHITLGGYGLGLGNGFGGSLISTSSFAGGQGDTLLPSYIAASPSLSFGRIATNHTTISPGFHPYRR